MYGFLYNRRVKNKTKNSPMPYIYIHQDLRYSPHNVRDFCPPILFTSFFFALTTYDLLYIFILLIQISCDLQWCNRSATV